MQSATAISGPAAMMAMTLASAARVLTFTDSCDGIASRSARASTAKSAAASASAGAAVAKRDQPR